MTIIYSSKPLRDRDEHDFYPTPKELIRASLRYYALSHSDPGMILDPGCGGGVWGEVAKEIWPKSHIVGVDIRDVPKNSAYGLWKNNTDFLTYNASMKYVDLVIGNPPFKFAEQFLEKCFGTNIIFLLRASFLESKKRYKKYYTNPEFTPSEVLISTRRISFTGNKKSDNTMYAVYYWIPNSFSQKTKLDWLDWEYDR